MKPDLELTPEEFDRLLAWLDSDREKAGERFLKICERLTRIIASRGCHEAEDIFFEAARRIAKKPSALFDTYEGDPARYFHGVAHNVYLEWLNKQPDWTTLPPVLPVPPADNDEEQLDCLDHCLRKLESQEQDLLLRYYCGQGQTRINERKKLCQEFNVTENALRIRVSRLRQTMSDCLKKCLGLK